MSTFCTSAAEYWLTQIDRSFVNPGYSEHSGTPGFPGLRIPEPPAIFLLLRCIVEVSFPLDRSANPIAFVGAARPSLQPPISQSLPFRAEDCRFRPPLSWLGLLALLPPLLSVR